MTKEQEKVLEGSARPVWSWEKLELSSVDYREPWMSLGRGKHSHMWRVLAAWICIIYWGQLREAATVPCNNHWANDNQGSIGGIQLPNSNKLFSLPRRSWIKKTGELDKVRKNTALSPTNTHLLALRIWPLALTSMKQAVPLIHFSWLANGIIQSLLMGKFWSSL